MFSFVMMERPLSVNLPFSEPVDGSNSAIRSKISSVEVLYHFKVISSFSKKAGFVGFRIVVSEKCD